METVFLNDYGSANISIKREGQKLVADFDGKPARFGDIQNELVHANFDLLNKFLDKVPELNYDLTKIGWNKDKKVYTLAFENRNIYPEVSKCLSQLEDLKKHPYKLNRDYSYLQKKIAELNKEFGVDKLTDLTPAFKIVFNKRCFVVEEIEEEDAITYFLAHKNQVWPIIYSTTDLIKDNIEQEFHWCLNYLDPDGFSLNELTDFLEIDNALLKKNISDLVIHKVLESQKKGKTQMGLEFRHLNDVDRTLHNRIDKADYLWPDHQEYVKLKPIENNPELYAVVKELWNNILEIFPKERKPRDGEYEFIEFTDSEKLTDMSTFFRTDIFQFFKRIATRISVSERKSTLESYAKIIGKNPRLYFDLHKKIIDKKQYCFRMHFSEETLNGTSMIFHTLKKDYVLNIIGSPRTDSEKLDEIVFKESSSQLFDEQMFAEMIINLDAPALELTIYDPGNKNKHMKVFRYVQDKNKLDKWDVPQTYAPITPYPYDTTPPLALDTYRKVKINGDKPGCYDNINNKRFSSSSGSLDPETERQMRGIDSDSEFIIYKGTTFHVKKYWSHEKKIQFARDILSDKKPKRKAWI